MTLTMSYKDFLLLRNYMYCKAIPKNHFLCQNNGIISDEKNEIQTSHYFKND